MTLAPGVDAGTFPQHRAGSREYLAVETGTLTLTLDGTEYRLQAGDSIYHAGDCEHGYPSLRDLAGRCAGLSVLMPRATLHKGATSVYAFGAEGRVRAA
jgi:quercetin dioxygenase-like cupin family protein